MPQIANFGIITLERAVLKTAQFEYLFTGCQGYLVVTLELFEVHDIGHGCGIPHPLNCLPRGHQPHILLSCGWIQEQLKPLFVVRGSKPNC